MNLFLKTFVLLFSVLSLAQSRPHYDFPYNPLSQPLTLRANVILLTRDDGSGNYNLNDPEEKQVLIDFLERINQIYANFVQPPDLTGCYTGLDFYPSLNIKVDFNIIEVKNSYAWNYLNSGSKPEEKNYNGFSPTERWYLKSLDDSLSKAQDIPKGINMYFTNNGDLFDEYVYHKNYKLRFAQVAASQFPSARKLHRSSQIHVPNRYMKYHLHKYAIEAPWSKGRSWHIGDAKGVAHELGHSFGLGHSNEYHGTNKCKYTIMSQKHSDPQNWLQPTEIKKVHYNLTRTNLMQFITPESFYKTTMRLYQDAEWTQKRRFYSNIEVMKEKTLTISDTLILAPQAQLILHKKAQLILKDNAVILDAYGNPFTQIKKHRRAKIISEN